MKNIGKLSLIACFLLCVSYSYSQKFIIVVNQGVVKYARGKQLTLDNSHLIHPDSTVVFHVKSKSKIYNTVTEKFMHMAPNEKVLLTYEQIITLFEHPDVKLLDTPDKFLRRNEKKKKKAKNTRNKAGTIGEYRAKGLPASGSDYYLRRYVDGISNMTFGSDTPVAAPSRAFIESIDEARQTVLINFTTSKNIIPLELSFANLNLKDTDKKPVLLKQLHKSDAIDFVDKDSARLLPIVPDTYYVKGRIDYINKDTAYVDGHKVVLAANIPIDNDEGKAPDRHNIYENIDRLKPGFKAQAIGMYSNGVFVAQQFKIRPSYYNYQKNDTTDFETYSKFSAQWNDPLLRTKLLGTHIPRIGRVVDDNDIQEYVNRVGQKLLPEDAKAKKPFYFIVVNERTTKVITKSNGLCYIGIELLLKLQNEAQLAAILATEIAHTLNLHNDEAYKLSKAINQDQSESVSFDFISSYRRAKMKLSVEYLAIKRMGMGGASIIGMADLSPSEPYSQSEQLQADRVGLSFMVMAGYDPAEAAAALRNMSRKKLSFERILFSDNIKEMIDGEQNIYSPGIVNTARFIKVNEFISLYWSHQTKSQATTPTDKEYKKIQERASNYPEENRRDRSRSLVHKED